MLFLKKINNPYKEGSMYTVTRIPLKTNYVKEARRKKINIPDDSSDINICFRVCVCMFVCDGQSTCVAVRSLNHLFNPNFFYLK